MTAIEIQAHFSTWFGPILLRRGRELAALVGGWRQLEDMTDEGTRLHEPAPAAGARLRDVSVAFDNTALDVARVSEGTPQAAPPIRSPTSRPRRSPIHPVSR